MSDIITARTELAAALSVVLPGRTYANPPTSNRYVTPSIFIEQVIVGGDITEPLATFPVWIVTDGTVESQVEAHDTILWNALIGVYPLAAAVRARPVPLAGLRATVIEVDVLLDVFTLCGAPPASAYEIPTLAG